MFLRNLMGPMKRDEWAKIVVNDYHRGENYDYKYLKECSDHYIVERIRLMEDILRKVAASKDEVLKKRLCKVMEETNEELAKLRKFVYGKQLISIKYGKELVKKCRNY